MHIQFAELPVFDQDRAKTFYTEHLGCEIAADAPHGQRTAGVGSSSNLRAQKRRCISSGASDEAPLLDEPVLVLVDDDVGATVAALKSRGVEIITEPQEAPWQPGRTVAEFRDSEGNRMVISQQDRARELKCRSADSCWPRPRREHSCRARRPAWLNRHRRLPANPVRTSNQQETSS